MFSSKNSIDKFARTATNIFKTKDTLTRKKKKKTSLFFFYAKNNCIVSLFYFTGKEMLYSMNINGHATQTKGGLDPDFRVKTCASCVLLYLLFSFGHFQAKQSLFFV